MRSSACSAREIRPLLWFAAAALWVTCAGAPVARADDRPLTIFHASTLSGFIRDLSRRFRSSHPEIEVRAEASGSLDAIRKVTDLRQPCDILLSADWRLLNKPLPGVEPWVAVFAGNAMAILYTERSRYASEINAGNWYEILARRDVRYGHSDPARDPEGYWTLILWQLAERYYRKPGLAARLEAGCPPANTRPASVNLIALLDSGELDYYFGYASDVRLGNLRALLLPLEINLSDFRRRADYAAAAVEIGTGTIRETVRGAPIAYGVTLTTNPPNRKAAIEFLRLLLGPEGEEATRRSGLIAYPKAFAIDPVRAMPPGLKELTTPFRDVTTARSTRSCNR